MDMTDHETIEGKGSKKHPKMEHPDFQQSVKDERLQLTGFLENKTPVVLKSVAEYRQFNSYCFPKYVHSLQIMQHHSCDKFSTEWSFQSCSSRVGEGGSLWWGVDFTLYDTI
jgi:hypothetical protein